MNNNGKLPAYPSMDMNNRDGLDRLESKHEGLTKREMFAMAAMQGMISTGKYTEGIAYNPALTKIAIEIADELLEQLDS